jgi:hypothetical protein
MGHKYRFKLLEKEIAQVNKILDDSGVTFTFEDVKDYLNGIQKIGPVLHKSYDRYLKFIGQKDSDKFKSILRSSEYEVTDDMKLVSVGYGYQYKYHEYCPVKNVRDCNKITNYIFNDIGLSDCVFDYNSEYGLIYSGDDETYEGLYFWLNQTILDRTTIEQKRAFFQFLYVDNTHIDFMCSLDSDLRFNYIGFNDKNLVVKYAVKFPREDFLERNPKKIYRSYSKIDDVIKCIEDSNEKTNITMQFVPDNSDAIAIESEVSVAQYQSEVKLLIFNNIICEAQGNTLLEMPIKKYSHTMFKYKWDTKDNLQVKVYYIEDLS